MSWDAVAAVGEILGAAAVLVTLLYLARQVRQSNQQALLASVKHSYDTIHRFAESVFSSEEVALLLIRGRRSLDGLSETEQIRFEHLHIVVLNIIEANFIQLERTASKVDERYLEWSRENLAVGVRAYFDHPGTRELWTGLQALAQPDVRAFIDGVLGSEAGAFPGHRSQAGEVPQGEIRAGSSGPLS